MNSGWATGAALFDAPAPRSGQCKGCATEIIPYAGPVPTYCLECEGKMKRRTWGLSVHESVKARAEERAEELRISASEYVEGALCRDLGMVPPPRTPSKLSDGDAAKIRQRRAEGATLRTLATEHGVTEAAISKICAGKNHRSGA